MQVGNAAILIIVGIVILWVILSGKGACIGGAVDCMMGAGAQAPSLNYVGNLPNVQAPGTGVTVPIKIGG